ncbi:unnamed protein product [Microthlaspi erraticum]|uniref:Retrotransposon gag domain-containing protein n=1 Tax=Microthlaspi erraticum TaxID=1685480 RepID=A0A6D2K4Z2_9BRAS|nr:unnamed protein product [Microthlaspi erraticum]
MSLADKAHQWEKSLPHGTITTWDECKKAFLAKFFSTGRTAKLRSEISSFIRGTMRLLLRLGRDSRATQVTCGNIANSNGSYGEEYDRTNRSSTHHSIESTKLRKDVKSLNEKLDKLILAQSTMKKVNFVSAEEMEPVQEGEDTQFAEVCYMSNGQGGYNKGYIITSPTQPCHTNTDVANPQDQVYPQQQQARSSQAPQHGYGPKNNYQGPQGTFPGQADGVVDTSKKLAEINSKIENLNTRVYSLENHASSVLLLQSKDNYLVKLFRTPRNSARLLESRLINLKCSTTVAFHTSPVELAQQARSAARSSRTLARSSQISSVLKPILLDPYQPVDPSSGRLLSQSHKEVIHKFRRDLSDWIELPSWKA